VKTTASYQLVSTEIDTRSDTDPPSGVLSGDYDAHVYNLHVTVTPLTRLYLTGLFSYRDVRSSSFDNGIPSVIDYEGDVFVFIGTAGYAFDEKTDLSAHYLYTRSDNFADNSADGLPLGIDNRRQGLAVGISRKVTKTIEAGLRYGFYTYEEHSNGGVNDYRAHLIGARGSVRF
jgi:hypothetical protein